ncbi:MAG: hypothetical protein N2648_06075 [Aquificaceae bacterium]|nr:hypothetical protein [Aquificaceae bacterium]MCX7990186.1 hypothetical protein [Aquificaceae bacterium]MDW8294967.1 hypothetical protein [Aquificaceae bacterium]
MKRLLLLLPFLLSLGEPVKDQKLKVELEDKSGLKHNLRGLVCGGKAFLRVREGNVDYSLDFSSIKSLEVLGQEGQQIKVRISFKNRASREYTLPADTYCKGNSQVGEAGFYVKDVKAIFITVEEK